MKFNIKNSSILIFIGLSSCETVPENQNMTNPNVAPMETCIAVSELRKVELPAETKIQYAITIIDNPPYEPIENKVKREIVTKQASIYYQDSNGNKALDICDKENIIIGGIGPEIGETINKKS
ncbi:MAG: hypothetical protein P8N24_00855 [Hellea sp.]|nr:hypothetical protein [Hellea sp.]